MGTCLDWHSTIVQALPSELSEQERSRFALQWRQSYFDYNAERLRNGQPVEDFDETQRRVLESYLDQHLDIKHLFTTQTKENLVHAWHNQRAWPDVAEALRKLKHERGLEVLVHANGSTRRTYSTGEQDNSNHVIATRCLALTSFTLFYTITQFCLRHVLTLSSVQLDLTRSAGLQFDMLLSSELLGTYKPGAESYHKATSLLKLRPEECVTVAAHAYDTRGAKAVGMKTVYIYRWTDDILEDHELVKHENDAYLLDMMELDETIAAL